MSFTAGTQLGPYEIAGVIGAGGMGEVYRATDTKLGREVAIKTLPSALAQDADRLARFEREAKLLAAINHAHIASVYSLDEHDGVRFLAMELVEGESLEEALKRGPLPTEEALRLALQIAEALEAAHERGVVHRDLKPANVMLGPGGQVKVLDFGLAKAFSGNPSEASPAHSPALSLAMTQAGLVLGTAGYMSPEQASGQATDQRADIWAFGVVLYEMLTGMPLFGGESVQHILADVLRTEPDWNRLPKDLHPRIRQMLERCLEKKPRNRYHSIADVRIDIEQVLTHPEDAMPATAVARPARRWTSAAAAAVIGALAAGAAVWAVTRPAPPAPPQVSRYLITPPSSAPLANLGGLDIAMSPDGARFAYFARDGVSDRVALYLREFDKLDATLVPGTEGTQTADGAVNPFFSSDGNWIGFRSLGQGIMRASVSGGPPIKMLDDQFFLGGYWTGSDTLIFSSGYGLMRASTGGGGTPELIVGSAEPSGPFYLAPQVLPGGRAVLYGLLTGDQEQIAVVDLETGEEKILIEGGANPMYAPTGHIVFARGTTLMGVRFDLDRLAVIGEPVALLQGVRHPGTTTAADYLFSDTGTLIYVPGGAEGSATGTLVWVDRAGNVTEQALIDEIDSPRDPRLSPDGTRVLLTTGQVQDGDLWVYDLGGRPPILISDENDNRLATWSPDGTQIAFLSNRGNGAYLIYTAPADGSAIDPPVLRTDTLLAIPMDWSADGDLILVTGGTAAADISATRAEPDAELRDIASTMSFEFDADLSPNGRWLAYVSDRTGQAEIFVKAYPDGVPQRVSRDGGYEPRWSAKGDELFYLRGNSMMAVRVETDAEFSFDTAVELFSSPFFAASDRFTESYDVASDGRFLMIEPAEGSGDAGASASIVVVENWFEELKRLVPTDR